MATVKGPLLLPGDQIDPSNIPTHPKKPLQLGPGLRHIPPSTILPTVAGQLITDNKKNSIWVEFNGGRYVPSQGDLVIGQVHHGAADFYYVQLTPHTSNALLPVLAFEMATKKTRPQLANGQLVYARVSLANKHMDAELECVNPATGKADGLGPLKDGMLFTVSLGFARRLLMPKSTTEGGVVVLEELGNMGLGFEIAVGRNGKVWVNSEATRAILIVGRALRETDEGRLDVHAQRQLVKKLVRETS
ncbi:exosome non-catalytic core subunit rrp40 [Cytospora paraplurivora]|uniref:Ribosomal RNA-processing protein 40 n=1 Tax=Cytospora paraplurivora TaxID=2898453 RepID=A0AAN9U896_9PEZI